VLQYGTLTFYEKGDSGILSYFRTYLNETFLVILNFRNRNRNAFLPNDSTWELIYSTVPTRNAEFSDFTNLEPYEGLILKMNE
jgi:hypothetical protein